MFKQNKINKQNNLTLERQSHWCSEEMNKAKETNTTKGNKNSESQTLQNVHIKHEHEFMVGTVVLYFDHLFAHTQNFNCDWITTQPCIKIYFYCNLIANATILCFFFSFGLFPSEVTTENHLSPPDSVLHQPISGPLSSHQCLLLRAYTPEWRRSTTRL